ncbi:MAG: DUF1569 domain-containing protein [Phycisphaerae bacterium]|nr:DUF1569 domain-containing protein [Phycisphaerae bacterium]
MPVKTATAPRRELSFHCLGCLKSELDRIDAAHAKGALRTTGNWSAGEILDHCAILIESGLDGAPSQAPFIARLFGKLMKKSMLKPATMMAGFQLPKGASWLLPRPGATYEQGMARMRKALARIDAGEKLDKPSGWLGPLTHDEWVRLNLNHTQLHLGFVALDDAAAPR